MLWLSRRKSAITVLLFAFSSILSATPRLVLTSYALGPIYVTPGTNGPVQSLVASNAGDGILSVSTSTSATWLAASVGTQTACTSPLVGLCFPISVSLNTVSLAPGNYTEYVTVVSPATIDAPQQVPVNVIVANVPSTVTLYAAPNGGTASVNIYPHGAVAAAVTTQSGGGWLSIVAPKGTTTFGTPYAITATSQTGQAAGTYTGTVTISGSPLPADNQTINVTLNVTASPIIQLNNQNVLMTTSNGDPQTSSVITFSNVGMGTLSITGASLLPATNSLFSLNVTGASSVTVTASPLLVPPGVYTAIVTLKSNAANSALVSIPVELTVAAAGGPNIYQGSIVNAATFLADPPAQGDIVSIFGDQFGAVGASFTNPTNTAPLPGGIRPNLFTNLGGVQVLVNGVAAPLYYVSRQQINFQMPYEAVAGQLSTVQVALNGVNGNIRSVMVAPTAPRILVWPQSTVQGNYGIVVNGSDNTISLPAPGMGTSRLSKPGDVIVIYCIGLGQTTPGAVTGAPATSSPLLTADLYSTFATFGNSLPAPVQVQSVFKRPHPNYCWPLPGQRDHSGKRANRKQRSSTTQCGRCDLKRRKYRDCLYVSLVLASKRPDPGRFASGLIAGD